MNIEESPKFVPSLHRVGNFLSKATLLLAAGTMVYEWIGKRRANRAAEREWGV